MKKSNITQAEINEEMVMMDMTTGNYFGLDAVGSRIWELIDTTTSPEDIVATLVSEFDVQEDICKNDVEKFLQNLLKHKLIDVC